MALWSPLWKWFHKLNVHEAPDGPVNLNSQRIINLADPTLAQDADTKAARDAAIAAQKLNVHALPDGPVNLNSQRIINLADPTLAQDADTKAARDAAIAAQKLNVHALPDGPVNLNSQRIINLGTPTTAADAVTKNYSDSPHSSKARAIRTAAQAIPDWSWTIVQYNIEVFDALGEYDNVTHFRFTASKAGYYYVRAYLEYAIVAWGAGQIICLTLFRNGSEYSELGFHRVEAAITASYCLGGSDIVYLGTGDYIDIRTVHNRGVTTDTGTFASRNYLSIHRLS